MKIYYKNKDYDIEYPLSQTLLDLKSTLQTKIKDLKEREIFIILQSGKEQKLIEEKQYKQVVQGFKFNKDQQLHCYILKDYLSNQQFKNSQFQQQIDILRNQIKDLSNTISFDNSQKTIIQKQEQTFSYDQSIEQNKNSLEQEYFCSTVDTNQSLMVDQFKYQEKQMSQRSQIIIKSIIQSQIDDDEIERNDRENVDTIVKTLNPNCMICNQKIQQNNVFLSCGHMYHENCLKENLKYQILKLNTKLYCQYNCEIKNPYKILIQLDLKIYFFKVLNNQINEIKKKNKGIKICPNKGCSFFVIINNIQITQSFCPSCLMDVILV